MRRLVALLLIFGTLPGATVMAQSHDTVQEHVRSLDDQERLAALRRDTAALERLWSDEFVVNAPNNQVVVGRRAVLDTFVRAGVINFSTFERQIEFIQVDGPYVVIMGLATFRRKNDGPLRRRFRDRVGRFLHVRTGSDGVSMSSAPRVCTQA